MTVSAWVEVRKHNTFWFRYDPARRLIEIKRGEKWALIDLLEYELRRDEDVDKRDKT